MNVKSKKAVVLGATGLVGSELIKRLAQSEEYREVVAVTRRPIEYSSSTVRNSIVNFERLDAHAEAFSGDVLFSCLGTTKKQAGSIAAQRVVDYDYQLQVAKYGAANGVKHYVLVSSSGANANSLNPYLKMKGELEEAVSGLGFESVSIVQPSLLLGDRPQARLAENVGGVLLPVLCKLPGLTRYQPIHGRQVAEKLFQLSLNPVVGMSRISLRNVFPE